MPRTTVVPTTTPGGLADAHDLLSTDWDEDGTSSVYLPARLAPVLLFGRGWTREAKSKGGYPGAWISPDGSERVWETGDALQVALVAEACSLEASS